MLKYIKWDLSLATKYDLKSSELLIFVLIYSHCMDYGYFEASYSDIAIVTGTCRRTVERTIGILVEKKLIVKTHSNPYMRLMLNQNELKNKKNKRGYKKYDLQYGDRKLIVLEQEKFPWEKTM